MKKLIFMIFLTIAAFSGYASGFTKKTEDCTKEMLFNVHSTCPNGNPIVVGTVSVFYKCGTYEVVSHSFVGSGQSCTNTVQDFLLP